jgi:hypothetical protein
LEKFILAFPTTRPISRMKYHHYVKLVKRN